MGSQMGLEKLARVFWQGRSGMRWCQVLSMVKHLLKYEDPPHLLVIHCGGNDLGSQNGVSLKFRIRDDLIKIAGLLPNTLIVWSQILPRLQWRDERDHRAIERARKRLNNYVATFCLQRGWAYLRYPQIKETSAFFRDDKVHLSDQGNQVFINNLRSGLSCFLSSNLQVYPDNF